MYISIKLPTPDGTSPYKGQYIKITLERIGSGKPATQKPTTTHDLVGDNHEKTRKISAKISWSLGKK